jgi:DNA polymerase-1
LFDTKSEQPIPSFVSKQTIETTPHDYKCLDTPQKRSSLINKLNELAEFCFDTETTSLETVEAALVGLAISYKKGEAFYIPFPEDMPGTQVIIDEFKQVFENPSIRKIGQNLKYDIQVLRNYDIHVQGEIYDTMLAHYLLNPEAAHGMDVLAESYLNYVPVSIEKLIGPKGKKQKSMREASLEDLTEYAGEDADITFQLKEKLDEQIKSGKLEKLLHEVEEPLSFVLADMEYTGVSIDQDFLSLMSKDLQHESARVQTEIFKIAGEEFNIGSPKQLGTLLFDKLKLVDKPKKTKTGQYATGEDILSRLAGEHEIANKILEFREYQKLKSTYVDALPRMVSPKDNRVHTDYRQTIAVTGRLSSNNPNLQNIPIRTKKGREIRKAFVPISGDYQLFSADYSQIELRIMASFSKDASMMRAFKEGKDIHSNTASKVFKVPLEEVDTDMRRKAKEVNFGIIYGMSAFGLSQNLNIPRGEAAEIIEAYFDEFSAVKTFIEESIIKAKEVEYAETILGRRRYLRNINSRNFTMRSFDERNAVNAPIQGSAADLIKVAMINIHNWMKQEKLKSKMLMQVHDELVFEVHHSELELLQKQVKEFMLNAIPLDVPMDVGMGVGANWLEAH